MRAIEATDQLQASLLVFWNPAQAVDRVLEHHPWLLQTILLALQLLLVVFTYPLVLQVSMNQLPTEVTNESVEALTQNLRIMHYFTLAFSAALSFIWWYSVAGLLYILSILFSVRERPFSQMLSVAVLSSVYLTFEDIFLVLNLFLRDPASFQTVQDLQIPIGLNLVLGTPNSFLWSFFGYINLFELGTTLLMAYGFARITEAHRITSYLTMILIWLSWSAFRSLGALVSGGATV
ncbi:MAG: hypothetical protein ACRD1R_20620 [Acidobacteriota bacterium]